MAVANRCEPEQDYCSGVYRDSSGGDSREPVPSLIVGAENSSMFISPLFLSNNIIIVYHEEAITNGQIGIKMNDTTKQLSSRTIWGIIIVGVGVVFLLRELGVDISLGDFWPAVLVVPGLAFWVLFFSKRGQRGIEGVLIPGTTLVLYGAYFIYQNATSWNNSSETAFFYTLTVGLAFFSAHYLGNRSRGYLVPAWILTGVSALQFFSTTLTWDFMWSVVLIIVGLWVLLKRRKIPSNSAKEQKVDKK